MAHGAPDWTKLIYLRAIDEAGTIHDVLVDPSGRLVMLAYGYDGVNTVPLRVDALGRLVAVMTGTDGVNVTIIRTDVDGRMIGVIRDPVANNYLGIDAAGFATMVVKGLDGAALRTIKVDVEGRMVGVLVDSATGNPLAITAAGQMTAIMQGIEGVTYRTIALDNAGRIIAVFRDPTSDNYAAISDDGYLGAIIRGGSDITLELLVWLKFRSMEGAAIQDYSGNNHDGAGFDGVASSATYVDGIVSDAVYLAGSNDFIEIADAAELRFTSGSFSVEFWMKIDDITLNSKYLVCKGVINVDGWLFLMFGSAINVWTNQAAAHQASASSALESNRWYHIVVVRSGASIRIYVDGVDDTIVEGVHIDPLTNARDLRIGIYDDEVSGDLTGAIDEFRIYSRALSAEEVVWRYKRTHVSLDERYRPLSVDPEGRLEVSIADFAYKDQVLERGSTVYAGGGAQNEQSAVVPAGKMWVLTALAMHSNGSACTLMDIGIYDGVDNFIIASDPTGANVFQVRYQGQLILKPGDRINFAWGHDGTAYSTDWTLNGFELDYPY